MPKLTNIEKTIRAYDRAIARGNTKKANQLYTKMAKVADQRFVTLEKRSQEDRYKGAKSYSYATAQRNLSEIWGGGQDKLRFNRKLDTPEERAKNASFMKEFLRATTSTIKGINDIYKKRADTFNKNWGTNFSWQDFANLAKSEAFKKLFGEGSQFSSDKVAKAIGVIKRSKDATETAELINNALRNTRNTNSEYLEYLEANRKVDTMKNFFHELNKINKSSKTQNKRNQRGRKNLITKADTEVIKRLIDSGNFDELYNSIN